MKRNVKRPLLATASLATFALAWFAPGPEAEIAPVAKRPRSPDAVAPSTAAPAVPRLAASGSRLLTIRRRGEEDDIEPAFVSRSWKPPKPKVVAVVAAAEEAPQAPPLPFKFLGRYVEDGHAAVFLQERDRNLVVRKGDVIEGRYRVEAIADGNMTFVYVPLNQQQTLAIGASK